jgi:Cyclophilin type peptidyl-prolyl cis-trans isomerase/CLD
VCTFASILFDTAPHLDSKHVVFGRMVSGERVLAAIEAVRTRTADRPLRAVTVENCGTVRLVSGESERDRLAADAEQTQADALATERMRKAAEATAELEAARLRSAVGDTVRAGLSLSRRNRKRVREPSTLDSNKKGTWLDHFEEEEEDDSSCSSSSSESE